MSDIFIISDEHYGHDNIIQFCNRPFASTEEMNETMVERHNKKVPNKKSFLTIHTGDMFWQTLPIKEAASILARLHGRHGFLYGNHDELIELNEDFFRARFDFIRGRNKENTSHTVKFNKKNIVISHFAQRVWQNSHKGAWHVFGHSHGELPPMGKSFDIGVDCHNFEPWSLEEIEEKMNTLESHHLIPAAKVWNPNDSELQVLREKGTPLLPRKGDDIALGSLYEAPILGHDGKTVIGSVVKHDPSITDYPVEKSPSFLNKNSFMWKTTEEWTQNYKRNLAEAQRIKRMDVE